MSQKIYVSNLPLNIANEAIAEQFSKFGIVYFARVVNESETNAACIEMAFPEDAQNAIKTLNGTVFNGRLIKVTKSA
jgi:RNA recognition motif-containing protein